MTEQEKKELRRRRKIESAQRSRVRRRAQHAAVERRVLENNERLRQLEGEVTRLTSEPLAPPPYHAKQDPSRPSWFGDPF